MVDLEIGDIKDRPTTRKKKKVNTQSEQSNVARIYLMIMDVYCLNHVSSIIHSLSLKSHSHGDFNIFSFVPRITTNNQSINKTGTPLLDHTQNVVTVAKMLATKPLKHELATRPGPGGKKLTYLSGDSVTRTLNDIFGFDGWCLEVKERKREVR